MSNILPKKSWNVYNEKNKEKVRKDEEAAQIEMTKKIERANQAERESRFALLRKRANIECVEAEEMSKSESDFLNCNSGSQNLDRFTLFEEKPSKESSQPLQPLAISRPLREQHYQDDPMAKQLRKNKFGDQIKFDHNRNTAAKQIINKSYPINRRKQREERERAREEELLKRTRNGK